MAYLLPSLRLLVSQSHLVRAAFPDLSNCIVPPRHPYSLLLSGFVFHKPFYTRDTEVMSLQKFS